MDNGCISETGTHDELLKNIDSHYAKLWNMQIRGGGASSNTSGAVDTIETSASADANM